MNQDKTQKSLTRQVISQEAQYVGFRKAESQIPASTMSFTKQFMSNDSREENFGNFKMSGPKTYTIPSTDITAGQFGNLKLAPMNVEVKENETEKGKTAQAGATVWDGPLSRYNTFVSTKTPEECMKGIEQSVTKLEQDQCVDWEIEEYNAFGRMYHGLDVSEFLINVYISSDNQYQSVIEIRRSSGDTFVHDEFFRQIAKSLEDEGILEQKDDDPKVDFSLSLALEPLSLDNLTQLDTSLFQDLTCNDTMSGDETSISDLTDTTSTEQLGDELIDVVTDRTSYQDVFRHSSGVLCQELKTNSQLLQYVAIQKNILERLLKPLTEDFYDTLIIRNILQVVKQLLQYQNHKVFVHTNCAKEIAELRTTWANNVQHNYINMRFCKSQQIEKLCSECLNLLQKRT